MHRSRAPSIAPGTFFVAQSWADCITNMAGFNLRQAQRRHGRRGLAAEAWASNKYEATFRENEIDETVLPSLTAEDLKDLGVGHCRASPETARCYCCFAGRCEH